MVDAAGTAIIDRRQITPVDTQPGGRRWRIPTSEAGMLEPGARDQEVDTRIADQKTDWEGMSRCSPLALRACAEDWRQPPRSGSGVSTLVALQDENGRNRRQRQDPARQEGRAHGKNVVRRGGQPPKWHAIQKAHWPNLSQEGPASAKIVNRILIAGIYGA